MMAKGHDGNSTAEARGSEDESLAGNIHASLWHRAFNAEPIPFFGELGSVNPVFVLPVASVGTLAIRRFLWPVSYQDFPATTLPADLSA